KPCSSATAAGTRGSNTRREVRVGFTFRGDAGVIANLAGSVPGRRHAAGALLLEAREGEGVEATARSLALWHGAIGTQALGRRLREMAERRGLPRPLLLGLVGEATGYLTTPQEYEEGAYEARSALYGRDGGPHLEEALEAALNDL
ncbi:MAG: hypothetical protein ACC662_08750, partial [Planctomycetota bacterium]